MKYFWLNLLIKYEWLKFRRSFNGIWRMLSSCNENDRGIKRWVFVCFCLKNDDIYLRYFKRKKLENEGDYFGRKWLKRRCNFMYSFNIKLRSHLLGFRRGIRCCVSSYFIKGFNKSRYIRYTSEQSLGPNF